MATPKPSKAARAATKAGRLNRNVTRRNIPEVRKGSEELLKVLSKRENEAQAIELIKQYAMEADPSRPGYEGNEIIAPFVRAIAQLPNARRLELLEKAGNPEIFSNLSNDIMTDIMPDSDFDAAREQVALEAALGVVPEERRLPPQQNPSTVGGSDYRKSRANMDVAPIDRTVSPDAENPEKARQQVITGIIGVPAAQEYYAATGLDPETGLPRTDPVTGFPLPVREPTLPAPQAKKGRGARERQQRDAETQRISDPASILRGTGRLELDAVTAENEEALLKELDRLSSLPVDPSINPFDHVMRRTPPEARASVGQRSDLEPVVGASGASGRHFIRLVGPEDLGLQVTQRASPPPRGPVENSKGFSSRGPSAFNTLESKNNAIARIQAELAEMQRRRAAFEANPGEAPIRQREGMRPLMKGTVGLQGPYSKGMTVDRQLQQSTRSQADRVMETLYRASEMMGLENDTDFGDYGKNEVRRLSDLAPPGPSASGLMPGEVDLGKFPEAWPHYAQVDPETGALTYPDSAPTAEFLADQMIGWYGVKDVEDFKRRNIPVLEYSLRRQAPLGPTTQSAYEASAMALRPNLGPRGAGRVFMAPKADAKPEEVAARQAFQDYAATRMFNPDLPMNRVPLEKSEFFGGGRPVTRPEAPEPTMEELNAILDAPVVDPVDALDAPVTGQPLEGLNDMDVLDRPVEGGDLDLSMNRMRRGPLSALIV